LLLGLLLQRKPLTEKADLIFAQLMVFTAIIFPVVFLYGLHWWKPCKVSLIGYWLLSECFENHADQISVGILKGLWNFLVKAMVFIFNHWIWSFGVNTIVFVMGIFQILCTLTLRDYLLVFLGKDLSNISKMYTNCLMYRIIQILALLTNVILNKTLACLVFASIAIASLGLSLLVRLEWNHGNLTALAMSLIMVVDSLLALLVLLGGMVDVYLESRNAFQVLMKKLHCNVPRRQRMYLQKFYTSCRPIRINLGSDNFLDALTPLTCLNCAANLTVQILLISSKTKSLDIFWYKLKDIPICSLNTWRYYDSKSKEDLDH